MECEHLSDMWVSTLETGAAHAASLRSLGVHEKFCMGMHRPEANPLPFYILFLTEKVPL